MLNTNFMIYSFLNNKLNIKSLLSYLQLKISTAAAPQKLVGLGIFGQKNKMAYLYQYSLNFILFLFMLATLYHFFFLSLTNQNVLCLFYLTLGATLYLFMSGFMYFIKLYSYNRFTGFMQDFWRLSLTVFWLIEGFLLAVILFVLSLGPLLPHQFYKPEMKLGCEYVQPVSFELFIIKHLPLLVLVMLTTKDDDESTTFEQTILMLMASILITWVLIDEFTLLFHMTNVFMRETPTYLWGSKKWTLSHSVLWSTKMWASYFGICTFTKFMHIIFAAYFILFWLASTLKEGGASAEVDNVEEASDENVKAAANFNLVAIYMWLSYMVFYPMFNRTVFVVLYNESYLSTYYKLTMTFIKEMTHFMLGMM